jgi:hypothetical protein
MGFFDWFKRKKPAASVEIVDEWQEIKRIHNDPSTWIQIYREHKDLKKMEDRTSELEEALATCEAQRMETTAFLLRSRRMKMIYVASPYTHSDPERVEHNFRQVSYVAAKLCSEGHVAISPILYGHTAVRFHEMPTDWEFWKNFCISILDHCDEMIVLKMEGWEYSKGVKEEMDYAIMKGIKITFMEHELVNF